LQLLPHRLLTIGNRQQRGGCFGQRAGRVGHLRSCGEQTGDMLPPVADRVEFCPYAPPTTPYNAAAKNANGSAVSKWAATFPA
jgi:hypothetical protein